MGFLQWDLMWLLMISTGKKIWIMVIYTLWLFNSLPWYRWPIEIDGLPITNGDFPWQTVK